MKGGSRSDSPRPAAIRNGTFDATTMRIIGQRNGVAALRPFGRSAPNQRGTLREIDTQFMRRIQGSVVELGLLRLPPRLKSQSERACAGSRW